ncbi:MAG: Na+/H+ antiporter subunit E [Woeseia sp.]
MRIAIAFLLFSITWLLWSGLYKPIILGFGLLSCVLVTVLAARTGFFEKGIYGLDLAPRLPRYWFWLLKEIVKANMDIARIILSPRLAISPTTVTVDASSLPPVGQATLANSITLTPGTLSVDISNNTIEVHCLTTETARQTEDGTMLRHVAALMGR